MSWLAHVDTAIHSHIIVLQTLRLLNIHLRNWVTGQPIQPQGFERMI